ncbi:MAG: branched-chain amino acid ABC transporter permease [Chloroflexota bacterium]
MSALRGRLSRRALVFGQVVLVFAIAIALALIPVLDERSFNLQRITFFLLWYAILASSWNMIGGYAGQTSFGHAAFLGMGAYVTGILWSQAKLNPLIALPIGGIVAAGYAVLVGIPTLRLRGPYFAIATIGIGEATRLFATNFDDIFGITLTKGVTGISLGGPSMPNVDPVIVHYATIIVFVIVMLTTMWIRAGRFGLGLFAVNMDRDAAETVGVPTARLQVLALAVSAFFAASAGGLYAIRQQFLDPASMFGFDKSIALVLMPIVGGLGTVWGPVFGAVLYSTVQDQLTRVVNNPYLPALIYGVLLVVIVMFEPLGIAGLLARTGRYARKLVTPKDGEP